jgi:hypothetical protein
MRKILSVALFLCAIGSVMAQSNEFLFANNLKDTLNLKIDYSISGNHVLGSNVARKMLLLQETYTFVERGTLTAPGDKTIVKKADIYYAVKKLNVYYKKAVKVGTIDSKEAAVKLTAVIDKSYSMFYEDTKKFEEYIRTQKKPEDIQKAFDLVKLY